MGSVHAGQRVQISKARDRECGGTRSNTGKRLQKRGTYSNNGQVSHIGEQSNFETVPISADVKSEY